MKWSTLQAGNARSWKAGSLASPLQAKSAKRLRKHLIIAETSRVEGYLFDRRPASDLQTSIVRIIPNKEKTRVSIAYSEIAALTFSGRDTAAGKTFEAWVKRYQEKKAAGEKNIQIEPERLE